MNGISLCLFGVREEIMGQSIGMILGSLRKEKGYSLKQLSEGLCDISELAKMESGELSPGYFRLDRLFGRLGESTERLEYVLPKETYRLYELQYQVQSAICHLHLEEAEYTLQLYEKEKRAGKKLHRQFIEQAKAQILWIRWKQERNSLHLLKEVLNHIESAIVQTMQGERAIDQRIFSAEELKLLLFRWEICEQTQEKRNEKELWEILEYLEQKRLNPGELVKVYPYAVLLLKKYSNLPDAYFQSRLEDALELLREEGRILYLPEILWENALLLKQDGKEAEAEELLEMRNALVEVETEYNIHFEDFPMFQHINRAFELDYEVIRKSRLAKKMSQEKLSEGLCTREALSKIERGKVQVREELMKKLLHRLKRERERVGMYVVADRFEAVRLEREIAARRQRFEHEEVEEILQKLEKTVDMSNIKNQQYIISENIMTEYLCHNIKREEAIRRFNEAITLTLPHAENDILSYRLTHSENIILNRIANLYSEGSAEEKEVAILLWERILSNYENSDLNPVYNIRDWELIAGNMAGVLTELERTEEAFAWNRKRMVMILEAGKGNELGRAVTTMACIKELTCKKESPMLFHQALNILKLMKMRYRYQAVKEYVEEKNV